MIRHRREGLSPAFDLSRVAYFLDFVLVPVAAFALIGAAWRLSVLMLAASIFAGVFEWLLIEYWMHRLVFHGRTVFEPMHQMHHALPKDMIGVASWGTFAGFALIWIVAELLSGAGIASAFTAGVMLGYLFYCAIHVRFHHHGRDAKLSRYVAFMNAHHTVHHRGARGNFGVSTHLMDLLFRTKL
jgi:dihydroceramide fatty acyl 2-hydroxylase